MSNSTIPENKPHPPLSHYVLPNNSSSKPAKLPFNSCQIIYESTSPSSGPPPELWPELPRANENACGLVDSPIDSTSNTTEGTGMMDRQEESAYYRSSMATRHSTRAREQEGLHRAPPTSQSPLLLLSSWCDFPPTQAPEFETDDLCIATTYGKPPDPLPEYYLDQSRALQRWMHEKLEEIIQLRKGAKSQEREHSTIERMSSTYLESGWLDKLKNELRMARVNNKMPEGEPRLVQEFLDAWTDFVDIKSHENRHSTRRYWSEFTSHSKPGASNAEPLLGHDRSKPAIPSHAQSYFVGSPGRHIRMSFDEAVASGLESKPVSEKARTSCRATKPGYFDRLESMFGLEALNST